MSKPNFSGRRGRNLHRSVDVETERGNGSIGMDKSHRIGRNRRLDAMEDSGAVVGSMKGQYDKGSNKNAQSKKDLNNHISTDPEKSAISPFTPSGTGNNDL